MRKLYTIAVLFLISTSTLYGGVESDANVTSVPVINGFFPHFDPGTGFSNGKATWQDMRLIGKTYLSFNNGQFVPDDSVVYMYSGRRGSVPNGENPNNDEHVLFDVSTSYLFDKASQLYANNKQRHQVFVNDNKIKELIYKNWHTQTSRWKNSEKYKYTYDMDGKMQTSELLQWYGTLWTNSTYSTLSYDNKNNVVEMNSTSYEVDFVYDASNNLVTVEDKIFVQGTGWTNNKKKSYVYSGKDVTEYTLQEWVNGTWQHEKKWEYQYDTKGNVVVSVEYYWSNNWVKSIKNEYTYDQDGNIIIDIKSEWNISSNTFVNLSKEERTYNSKSLPETITTYSWNGSSWYNSNGDYQIRYYYEYYDATTLKDQSILATANLNIYPIPAYDNINITYDWDEPQDFTVSVVDMSGRLVYNNNETATKHYNGAIQVQQLPAGQYFLSISSADVHTGRIIVVSH